MLARAVAAAHQRGIVHRDLKPSNILLAPPRPGRASGARRQRSLYGVPKITDFGFAKQIDAEERRRANAHGRDHRHPVVHGPGAGARRPTNRPGRGHLRPGRLPLRDADRPPAFQGGHRAGNIAAGHERGNCLAEPPSVLRSARFGNHLPEMLEKRPAQRYPTAVALADDLHRYINGEPTHARPPGRAERVWRWCRRYPAPRFS